MMRSTTDLIVANEQELRDSGRIRRLWRRQHWGNLVAAVGGWIVAAALVIGLFVLEQIRLTAADPGPFADNKIFFTTVIWVSVFAGLAAWFGASFWREVFRSPLYLYQRSPERFRFSLGELAEARFIPGDRRSLGRYFLRGGFSLDGRTIPIIELIESDLWKKLKWRLPRPVWVIYDPNDPAVSALAGVPRAG